MGLAPAVAIGFEIVLAPPQIGDQGKARGQDGEVALLRTLVKEMRGMINAREAAETARRARSAGGAQDRGAVNTNRDGGRDAPDGASANGTGRR